MTNHAQTFVSIRGPRRIEVGAMRAHAESDSRRMTPQTVVLPMARDAALEVLARRLGVAQHPESLIVMEGGHETPLTLDSESEMACSAECLRVVATAAVTHASVGFWAVGCQKVQGVKCGGTLCLVAGQAGVFRVAGRAVGLSGGCGRAVGVREVSLVEGSGRSAWSLHAAGPFLTSRGDHQNRLREVAGSPVAGEARTLVVTDRAVRRRFHRQGPVGKLEPGDSVRWRPGESIHLLLGKARLYNRDVAGSAISFRPEVALGIGDVATQAGGGSREPHLWLIFRTGGKVTDPALEGVEKVLEAQVRGPWGWALPLYLRGRGTIVAGGAEGKLRVESLLFPGGEPSVASLTLGEEDLVCLMGETPLGPQVGGCQESTEYEGQSSQRPGARHGFPLPARPGSLPMGISRFRWRRI